jgi:hypothetical protein
MLQVAAAAKTERHNMTRSMRDARGPRAGGEEQVIAMMVPAEVFGNDPELLRRAIEEGRGGNGDRRPGDLGGG